MGLYDVFVIDDEHDAQIKAFQSNDLRVFRIGQRIPEAIREMANCLIVSVEDCILEIKDGIYTGFKDCKSSRFTTPNHSGYGYRFDADKLKQYIIEQYGLDYLSLPVYDKYGSKLI